MKFHFDFPIKKRQPSILHQHTTMLVGSCFTENIGEKLRKFKFNTLENPHGILFNPASVAESITQYVNHTQLTTADVFPYLEAWHSWKHHSRLSALTAEACVEKINESGTRAHAYLKTADHLVITLGSAWTYTLTDAAPGGIAGSIVANNHKGPAEWFTKKLLRVEETLSLLDNMLHRLFLFNPNLHIVFTISPVRHLREGVVENNRSKAVLIQAVHQLVDKFEKLYYFPAYELVIDDLRDYRFYAEDLVHPNYHATQYVWEKFTEACMNDATRDLMKEIAAINLAHQHKPFNAEATAHKQFLASSFEKTKHLQSQHPYLNLDNELAYFNSGLHQ